MMHKRPNTEMVISYHKNIFSFAMCISKWIKWILKNSHRDFFLHFAIHSSNRHVRMLERIFCLFQCSRNIRWSVSITTNNSNFDKRCWYICSFYVLLYYMWFCNLATLSTHCFKILPQALLLLSIFDECFCNWLINHNLMETNIYKYSYHSITSTVQ